MCSERWRRLSETFLLRPHQKNKALTFDNLYDVKTGSKLKDKQPALKIDRTVLQRLIASYADGRQVNMKKILQHELMPIPISLAETNGALRTGSKTSLVECLTFDVQCPAAIEVQDNSCLVIDGQDMVIAIGKLQTCKTFGDAKAFVNLVNRVILVSAANNRVDVVFDIYTDNSMKASTHQTRTKTPNQLDVLSKVEKFLYHLTGIMSLLNHRPRLISPCSCPTNL